MSRTDVTALAICTNGRAASCLSSLFSVPVRSYRLHQPVQPTPGSRTEPSMRKQMRATPPSPLAARWLACRKSTTRTKRLVVFARYLAACSAERDFLRATESSHVLYILQKGLMSTQAFFRAVGCAKRTWWQKTLCSRRHRSARSPHHLRSEAQSPDDFGSAPSSRILVCRPC